MDREQFLEELGQDVPALEGKNIWIWGVGNTAQIYQEGLKRLVKLPVCGYCDNEPSKWGKTFGGREILSPEQFYQMQDKDTVVLLCTPQENVILSVGRQLEEKGVMWYRLDEAIFKVYKEEVMRCYDLLEDDLSKESYAHIIDCRMKNRMPKERYISRDPYFALRPFQAYGEEVFVDCGAYTGDTIEQYLWRKNAAFEKIIAFEPDAGNYKALGYRMERLKKEWNLAEDKVEMHNCAVGHKNGQAAFAAKGTMSSMTGAFLSDEESAGGVTNASVVSLDDFLDGPYTFLKADIEGFEYNMLKGAQKGISKYRPLIAVCIYHNAADLFQIQLLLHELMPDYKFAVRHHSITFDESILYAYIGT